MYLQIYGGHGVNADQIAQQAQDFGELFIHKVRMPTIIGILKRKEFVSYSTRELL